MTTHQLFIKANSSEVMAWLKKQKEEISIVEELPKSIPTPNALVWRDVLIVGEKKLLEPHISKIKGFPNVALILIGSEEDALLSYQWETDSFLLFNQVEVCLIDSIQKAKQKLAARKALWEKENGTSLLSIRLPSENGALTSIQIAKILFFEASGDYSWCYLKNGKSKRMAIHCGIGEVERSVRDKGFLQIHRRFIVNPAHIIQVFRHQVILSDKTVLPIAKMRRREVAQYLGGVR